MSYSKGEPFVQAFFDANGDPLALGTVEFFIWNTSTPTPVYSDSTGTSAGTVITLDSLGAPANSGTAIDLYFDVSVVYKIVRKDASGTPIDPTIGPYYGSGVGGSGVAITIEAVDSGATDSLYDYVGTVDNQQVSVGGYYTTGDGGGGSFYWDAASTDADDGGATILPTGHVGAGRWRRIINEPANVRMFGAKGDGVTDDSLAFQAAVDAIAGYLVVPEGDYIADSVTSASDLQIHFEGAAIAGTGLGEDIFVAQGSLEATGIVSASTCRTFLHFDPQTTGKNLIQRASITASNMHSVVAGRPASETQCGFLVATGMVFTDVECGIYLDNCIWRGASVFGNTGRDLKLKAVPTADRDSLLYNKYSVNGIFIDCSNTNDSNEAFITAYGNVITDVVNDLVDPITAVSLPAGPEYETHAICLLRQYNGSLAVTGNTIARVSKPDGALDCEGIVARGSSVIVSGNTLVDAGRDEGQIYAKATTRCTVIGNHIEYTVKKIPTDPTQQRGIIVSATEAANVQANTFVKCERGITYRSGNGQLGGNIFDDCFYGVYLVPTSANVVLSLDNNTFRDTDYPVIPLVSSGGSVDSLSINENVFTGHTQVMTAPTDEYRRVTMTGNSFYGSTGMDNGTVPIGNGAGAAQGFSFNFSGNDIYNHAYASSSGSFILANDGTYDSVVIENNLFDALKYPLWLRDRTYDNLIITRNKLLNPIAGGLLANVAAITVNESILVEKNEGDTQRLEYGDTASRPAVSRVAVGFKYFDTDLGKPIYNDGLAWVYADGTAV